MLPDLYVVDTHALLWYLGKHPRLSRQVRQILDDPDARLLLPAIAYAEALSVVERGRAPLQIDESELIRRVNKDSRVSVYALDQEVVETTLNCKAISERHDRQIVATAMLLQNEGFEVAILTRDSNIREANLVPTIW